MTLLCLMISAAAWAQTYSNANLNGKYAVQTGTPSYYTWSKTFTCPTNSTITYTPVGTTTTTSAATGVGTFDGAGNWSGSFTTIGKQNVSGSANTMSVTWNSACQVTNVNYGHIVYLASVTKTESGTYSINSTGTGTLTITTGGSGALTIQLAGTNSSGISTTVLLTSTQVNGQTIGTGIAVLQ